MRTWTRTPILALLGAAMFMTQGCETAPDSSNGQDPDGVQDDDDAGDDDVSDDDTTSDDDAIADDDDDDDATGDDDDTTADDDDAASDDDASDDPHYEECTWLEQTADHCNIDDGSGDVAGTCMENWDDGGECDATCALEAPGCSYFYGCLVDCDGGLDDLCDDIVGVIYGTCGGHVPILDEHGDEISEQEAYDHCVDGFDPVFACAMSCISQGGTCSDFWDCFAGNC